MTRSGRRAVLPISLPVTLCFPTTSSSSATCSFKTGMPRSRTIHIRFPSRSIPRPGPSGRRSGRYATSVSNIFRPACCISSMAASTPIPTDALPATPARRPSFKASSSWSNAMPTRSGGTIAFGAPNSTSRNSRDSYVRDLQSQFADAGRRLWVLDITSDLGIPSYVAVMHWMQNGHENIEFGSGSHFDRRIALLRSLTELTQFMSIGMMDCGSGEKPSLDGVTPLRLDDYPFLIPSDDTASPAGAWHHSSRQYARPGQRLRRDCGPSRIRFPRARPDAARRRGPRRQSARSGLAAFLSPLRARPALRCPGEAWAIGSPATGKRTHSVPATHLKAGLVACSPEKAEQDNRANHRRPAERPFLPSHAGRRKHCRGLERLFGQPRTIQRGGDRARGASRHRPAARLSCRQERPRAAGSCSGAATGTAWAARLLACSLP